MRANKFNERMIFSKTVLERLDEEALVDTDFGIPERAAWYAVAVTPSGKAVACNNYGSELRDGLGLGQIISLPPYQVSFLEARARLLMGNVCHGGMWLCAWTHPPQSSNVLLVEPNLNWQRLVSIWLDEDGDPQFTMECAEGIEVLASCDPRDAVEQAEDSWQKWHHLMREVLDPSEEQLVPKAILRERGIYV